MQDVFREVKGTRILFWRKINLDYSVHIHDEIEMIYVTKGGGTAFCDGKKYTLRENCAFLVFPNQPHYYEDTIDGEYITVLIKPSLLMGYGEIFGQGFPRSALCDFGETDDDGVIDILKMARKEYHRDGNIMITRCYLTLFFAKLLKFYEIEKSDFASDSVMLVLDYCSKHYKEEITVEEISKELKLSRAQISNIFSSRLNINFCNYINSLRVNDAAHLLQDGNYSVAEIAYTVGFSTIRTFNRAFLKVYGVTPTEYRNGHKKL